MCGELVPAMILLAFLLFLMSYRTDSRWPPPDGCGSPFL